MDIPNWNIHYVVRVEDLNFFVNVLVKREISHEN